MKGTNLNRLRNGAHLLILIAFTITALILFAEILVLRWEKGALPVLVCMIIYSWYMNFTQRFNDVQRVYLYVAFMMFCYFFYGVHQVEINVLTVSIVVIMVIYFIAELRSIISMATFAYFFTVAFNLAKAGSNWREEYNISLAQLAFQFFLVLLAATVSHFLIMERWAEKKRLRMEREANDRHREQLREQVRIVAKELGHIAKDEHGEMLLVQQEMPEKKQMTSLLTMNATMEGKIADLKDYADILSGRIQEQPEAYDVLSLLGLLKLERKNFEENTLPDLVVEVDPGMPKVLVGDRDKILNTIRHLVANGFRFTKEGGVQLKIYTHSYADEHNLCIEVNDTGMGIAQTDLERLLEQMNTQKVAGYRPGGMGLGLFLVSGYVKCMGGFFRIDSEWGKGTSVCISIPQIVADAAPCMTFDKKAGICLAYEARKYENDALNSFYDSMFLNLSEQFSIPAYIIEDQKDLLELAEVYAKVCLFVDYRFYEQDRDYYEGLNEVQVIVLADRKVQLPVQSNVQFMKKPIGTPELFHQISRIVKTIDKRGLRRKQQMDAKITVENLKQRDIRLHGNQNIIIMVDSMADLPTDIARSCNIPIIPFRIYTEKASFLDGVEVSQECALSYFNEYMDIHSMAPEEEDFREYFEKYLRYAKHIIYISTAKKVSVSYERACRVAEKMEGVTVFNSGQVSGGVALMAMLADEQVKAGKEPDEVIKFLTQLRPKVKTTFIIDNLDHLMYVGRVSKFMGIIARTFLLHPVIKMKRDSMEMGAVRLGNMKRVKDAYIQKIVKHGAKIDKRYAFVGSVGLSVHEMAGVKELLHSQADFDEVIIRRASAAISINCGVGTFGIIYIEK
ncbi:MAG: DegV family EDD domain-containing protein [Eubacterium sp.]|nr:DegV family EDD domain-containing protein [Eubacterium sp.]